MPTLPGRLCRCGATVPAGQRCPTCTRTKQQTRDAIRPSSSARGYDRRWYRFRASWLAGWDIEDPQAREQAVIQRATCADPYHRHPDRLEVTRHVDHKVPHRGDDALRFDASNLQPLCVPCHSYKSALLDGALGRAVQSRDDA